MPNAKDSGFKKIEQNLFRSPDELTQKFSERELERKNRILLCVSKKLDNPMISDKEMVDFLMNGFDGACKPVVQSTAYRDVAAVTRITGNVKLAAKSWYRYMIVEGAKKAYAIAEVDRDAKGMAAALDKIGKYTMADKEDTEIDWDQLNPPSWEPTDDLSIMGDDFEEMDKDTLEEKRKNLRSIFRSNTKKGDYVDFKEVSND